MTAATMAAAMSPKRKAQYPVEIHPEYLAELRRRVETGPGLAAVAAAAEMDRMTLWHAMHGGQQRVTVDTVERARAGLAYLEEGRMPPLPPPIVSVRSAAHHAWCRFGEELLGEASDEVVAALAAPDALRAAILSIATSKRDR